MPTQEQMDAAVEQLNQTNEQVEAGLVALNQIQLEKEGVQAGIERLNKILTDTKKQFDDINSSLDNATTARAGVLSELEEMKRNVGSAEAELNATLNANGVAKAAGETQSKEIRDVQTRIISDAQLKVDTLVAKKGEIEKQIAPLADQVSRLSAQIISLNAQITSLNGQISVATQTLSDINTKIADAQQSLTDIQAKSDSLTSEITAKKAQSAGLDTDIAAKNSTIADLNQKIAGLDIELKKNSTHNADFLKARAVVVEMQRTNEQRADFLKSKYGEFEEPFN